MLIRNYIFLIYNLINFLMNNTHDDQELIIDLFLQLVLTHFDQRPPNKFLYLFIFLSIDSNFNLLSLSTSLIIRPIKNSFHSIISLFAQW